jgi:putative endonuclease
MTFLINNYYGLICLNGAIKNVMMVFKKVSENKKAVLDKKAKAVYYIYILLLSNGHFYTGYTTDIVRRIRIHYEGKGSKCVRSFIPESIKRVWKSAEKNGALKAESYIKSLTRKEKEALVAEPALLKKAFKKKGHVINECRKYHGKIITEGRF